MAFTGTASSVSALLIVLLLVQADLPSALTLKGFVSCVDCSPLQNLAGMKVAVKCNHVDKQTVYTTTNERGDFKAEMPPMSSSPSADCHAVILGGPEQLCSFKKSLKSRVMKVQGSKAYFTLSTPLSLFSSCSAKDLQRLRKWRSGSNAGDNSFGTSKTVDIPLPPEWGFPPTSYYVPFIPIIGIP